VKCELPSLVKVLLHAAKYPNVSINGLLLGSIEGDDVKVADAVPLFHTSVNLAMQLEVALAMVEAYTKQSAGKLSIVGYYHAEARVQAADMTPVARKIADKISSKQSNAVAVVIDNRKLETFLKGDMSEHPFDLFTKDGSRGWRREPSSQVSVASEGSWQSLQTAFASLHGQQVHSTLVDFDNHLDDVSKDFLNPKITSLASLSAGLKQRA